MPPEYGELPIPKQDNNKTDTNDQIKDLINKKKKIMVIIHKLLRVSTNIIRQN